MANFFLTGRWYSVTGGTLTGDVSLASGLDLRILTDGTTGALEFGASSCVRIFRGAANRLDLASGDSFKVVSGTVIVACQIISDSSGNLASANGVGSFCGAITNLTILNGIITAAS